MRYALAHVFATLVLVGCASRVSPSGDASLAESGTDAIDVPVLVDVPPPIPCGDAGLCGPSEICIRGRCAGCCDIPPACIPIPTGCTGALACGCFASDPCGGCTRCQSVEADGIHCGMCMCACAAPWTPIETPTGPRPIAELRVGDLIYSVDHGVVVTVPVARTTRTAVLHHAVVSVALANGSVLEVSGRHPTADRRLFDALGPGDLLGDVRVVSVETVPYHEPFTYDILAASDTGAYFAAGALVGSTLRP